MKMIDVFNPVNRFNRRILRRVPPDIIGVTRPYSYHFNEGGRGLVIAYWPRLFWEEKNCPWLYIYFFGRRMCIRHKS